MKRYAIRVNCRNTGKPGQFSNPSGRKIFSLLDSSLHYIANNAKEAAVKAKTYVECGHSGWCFFGNPVPLDFSNIFFRVKERNTPRGKGVKIFDWNMI